MQTDSLEVREMPGMCVSTSARGTPACCAPPCRACLCSKRENIYVQEIRSISENLESYRLSRKALCQLGMRVCLSDHWEFLEAVALPYTFYAR